MAGSYGLRVRLAETALWSATTALQLALAAVTGVVWILLALARCVSWLTAQIGDLIAEVDQVGGEGGPTRAARTSPSAAAQASAMVVEGEVISVWEETVVRNV